MLHEISIHVLRVEDDNGYAGVVFLIDISIHVLRVEDDHPQQCHSCPVRDFNPRPPCGGRPRRCHR